MVINTNTQAQAAASNLQTSQAMLSKSLARLSSGSKIVSPSDDVAEESTQYARYNILVQAGTAMLAQANALPQSVLRLLQ